MENKILTLDKRNSLKEKKKRKKKYFGVPKYKHKPKLFLNHRADDSVHASPASPGKCRQSRKVSGVASLPINGGRVFYARTDPRYEITPVTPAGRKKFEGVVAGAWKPFVSLSLRRFVERGAVYHRRGLRFLVSPLSLSLSEGHQINHSLSSRVLRPPATHSPPFLASPLLLPNRPTIRNGFVREFTTYGMRFEARTLRGRSNGGEEEEEEKEEYKRREKDERFSRNVRFRFVLR